MLYTVSWYASGYLIKPINEPGLEIENEPTSTLTSTLNPHQVILDR